MAETLLQDAIKFFSELFENLRTGILFFGGPFDIFLAVLDIFITTLVIYYLLKLIRDSRAWQVLKGILLIVVLSQLFSLIGFQTIGFILSSTLSVLAIAFVVLFQPELRRALETVGRNSFNLISGMVNQEPIKTMNSRHAMIDSIVRAAAGMAESYTGALIIIERDTKLGELVEQDNAVLIDSVVSPSVLMQIFYKGSPLHDGAVLIRDGRIYAAKCHVPLSDNYHLRKEYGTRHRAAIGVSEMGDAIAVVVSEERGAISIAISGRLYTLDNPDALRTILHRQLGMSGERGVISEIFRGPKSDSATLKLPKKNKVLMFISSLLIAVFVWLYVLITVNPVETKDFSVALKTTGSEHLINSGLQISLPVSSVKISVAGRSRNLRNLSSGDIEAVIDFSEISSPSTANIDVEIKIRKLTYFEVREIFPAKITTIIKEP
ncbi:MAG: diadenylate cyclase CdaA [Eubacteriales bacterium]|nr:diadenylate cyclase CdaA [Eubacteriales bacterium]MDD4327251.1 diadenylate cyclase CdaA [Eubacteriales bacterium]MDD4716888.1 diadenylate cyclase CdaA [Eubacteriales bacterium]